MTHWNPMKTAPKDGTEIIILFDCASVHIVRLCWWDNGGALKGDIGPALRQGDIGWWSYVHSVTQEKIEMTPLGWIPMPEQKEPNA